MEQLGKDQVTIPYIAYESMLAKEDRQQKRIVIVMGSIIALLVILLVVTNVVWLVAWNQYDYVDDTSTEVDVNSEGGGNANYIGNDGDINNGTSDSTDKASTSKSTS